MEEKIVSGRWKERKVESTTKKMMTSRNSMTSNLQKICHRHQGGADADTRRHRLPGDDDQQ
jgi:hypothetical protein